MILNKNKIARTCKNMQEQVNKAEVIPSPIHHGLVVYVSLGDIGDIGGWDYTSRTIGPNVGMRMANLIYIMHSNFFGWLVCIYIYIIYRYKFEFDRIWICSSIFLGSEEFLTCPYITAK